jgi:hypothetical protein
MKKLNSKLWLAPLKLLTNFEKPSSNLVQRLYGEFNTDYAYRKLIIVHGREKLSKDLENHQRIHRNY